MKEPPTSVIRDTGRLNVVTAVSAAAMADGHGSPLALGTTSRTQAIVGVGCGVGVGLGAGVTVGGGLGDTVTEGNGAAHPASRARAASTGMSAFMSC